MNLNLIPTDPSLFFIGRKNDQRLGEWVTPISDFEQAPPRTLKNKNRIALFGCPDDQGVILNRGRPGASGGPDSIRKYLYKLTPPMQEPKLFNEISFIDVGNIEVSKDILTTHSSAQAVVKELMSHGYTVIALGGGHDFAAPHFFGFSEALPISGASREIGLINVDPHLDMRPLENGLPHSGSAFRAILDSKKMSPKNLATLGVRYNRNSFENYQYAKKRGVKIYPFEKLYQISNPAKVFDTCLKELSRRCANLYTTFDMDSCFEGEGTSAAPVLGLSGLDLCKMAQLAGANKKVRLFEIAEVAPSLDASERTSRIAAEMIYAFVMGFSQRAH